MAISSNLYNLLAKGKSVEIDHIGRFIAQGPTSKIPVGAASGQQRLSKISFVPCYNLAQNFQCDTDEQKDFDDRHDFYSNKPSSMNVQQLLPFAARELGLPESQVNQLLQQLMSKFVQICKTSKSNVQEVCLGFKGVGYLHVCQARDGR